MPILNVQVVAWEEDAISTEWVQQIADLAGVVFETSPGQTWVKLSRLDRSLYAENNSEPDQVPCPVFVSVTKKEIGDVVTVREEMKQLTDGIAGILGCPGENVHIQFEPDAVGRIAFGGKLVEDD